MDGIRRSGLLVLCAAGIAAAGTGCSSSSNNPHDGTHNIYFMGTVVDGVLNTPLVSADGTTPAYSISLVYGTTTVKGKVDAATGRYTVGPLPAWNDYGIIIDATAAGYRPFSSYNAGINPPAPPATSQSADIYTADTTQTLDFDAYVFPTSVAAPDVTLAIVKSDQQTTMGAPAAGTIRVSPLALSTIQGKTGEVNSQIWANSQDLFATAITDTFTGGTYTVTGSKLVYGVAYTATVYGVDGYQVYPPIQQNPPQTFQAGFTSSASITIQPLSTTPLMLVSSSGACHTTNAPVSTTTPIATVTFTFNANVVDATTSTGGGAEILDNSVFVATSGIATLKSNTSPTVQERGTSLTFSGNTVTLGWTPSVGLASPGASDVVTQVEYENLSQIILQQPNHQGATASLASLVSSLFPNGYILCGM